MKQFKATPKGMTLLEIMDYFSTDDKARKHLENITWANGPVCPRCQTNDQDRISVVRPNPDKGVRAGLYCCKDCRRQFTVTVGSIFEDTHIPLRKWLIAWYLLCASKKGISSLQLQRMLDLGSYKSALFMTHRIRFALKDPVFDGKLTGTVEVDECYFGPKTPGRGPGFFTAKKSAVVALVNRESGARRSVVVEHITGTNIQRAVRAHVEDGSTIHTDEHSGYVGLRDKYTHKSVRHAKVDGKREYYRVENDGEIVTTNYAESSFSLLKRGVVGTFHNISRKHLPLYVAEFDHRWNTRNDSDTERTISALKKARGKRITYKPLTRSV